LWTRLDRSSGPHGSGHDIGHFTFAKDLPKFATLGHLDFVKGIDCFDWRLLSSPTSLFLACCDLSATSEIDGFHLGAFFAFV